MNEPTKPKRPKRDKSIKIRLTTDEHQQLVKTKLVTSWQRGCEI